MSRKRYERPKHIYTAKAGKKKEEKRKERKGGLRNMFCGELVLRQCALAWPKSRESSSGAIIVGLLETASGISQVGRVTLQDLVSHLSGQTGAGRSKQLTRVPKDMDGHIIHMSPS
jgi:hypothetical protein